ncbi:MAG: MFS transporter [Candidatus Thorarchaeota archaeon]|nr:MFS transporter [Candidatus Thorarchaeota archaeon]
MKSQSKLGYADKIRLFRRDARLYIASGVFSAFSGGISGVIFNLYMLVALSEGGIEKEFLGFFLSLSMFATALVAVPAGLLTDRTSRKRVILAFNALSLIAVSIQYTTLDRVMLMLSQLALGLSGAFVQVAWTPYITDLSSDDERAHLFGVSGGMSLIGVLVGNLIGGFLPGFIRSVLALDWLLAYRYSLLLAIVPLVISSAMIIFMSSDRRTDLTVLPRRHIDLKNVTSWGFMVRYAATVSTVGLGAGMIVIYFNIFFSEYFHVSTEMIGVIFGINTVVLAAGNFASPALADRIGKVRTVVLTEGLSIPFLLMLGFVNELPVAVFAYVSRNVLMNMSGPVSTAFFMEGLTKRERATALGLVRAGDSLVRGVAAIIGGLLLAAGLYTLPYLLVSGLYVLAVLMFYTFFRNKEKSLMTLRSAKTVLDEDKTIEAT